MLQKSVVPVHLVVPCGTGTWQYRNKSNCLLWRGKMGSCGSAPCPHASGRGMYNQSPNPHAVVAAAATPHSQFCRRSMPPSSITTFVLGGGGWGGAGDSAVALAHLCHCIRVAKQRQQKRRVWGNKRRPRLTHVRWVQKKRNQSKVCICLIGNKEEEQPQHSKWMRSNQLCENTDIPFLLPILLQCHHTDKKVPSGTKQW